MNNTILVITGMPYSGISIISRGIKILKLNSLNHLSNSELISPKYINKLLLQDLNYHSHMVGTFSLEWLRSSSAKCAKKRIEKVLQLMKNSSNLFFASDTLFNRFMPIWNQAFKQFGVTPKLIVMLRHPWEIAQYLKNIKDIDLNRAHLVWLSHILLTLRIAVNMSNAVVSYDQFLADPVTTLIRIGNEINIKWPKDPYLAGKELLFSVKPYVENIHASNLSEKDKSKFNIYNRIYQELIAGQTRGIEDNFALSYLTSKENDFLFKEKYKTNCLSKTVESSDLLDIIFNEFGRLEKQCLHKRNNRSRNKKEAVNNTLFTRIAMPSRSNGNEIFEITINQTEKWQLIKKQVPNVSLDIKNTIVIQPLNTNGTVTISSIKLVNAVSGEPVYSVSTARQFDRLKLSGSVVRCIDNKNLKLIVTGDDSSISLTVENEIMADAPINFEMWINASKNQNDIKENNQFYTYKYKSTRKRAWKLPIIICTHHKAGTNYLINTFRSIQNELNKKIWYKFYDQNSPTDDWDICIHQHSRINELISNINFRGWHCIRHPKSLIYSAVLYHQRCIEEWAHIPLESFSSDTYLICTDGRFNNKIKDPNYSKSEKQILINSKLFCESSNNFTPFPSSYNINGKTYQEFLNSLPSIEEKILFEMRSYSRGVINDMLNFQNDNRFYTIKLEDISKDPSMYALREGFLHLGFEGNELEKCLNIAEKFCLWNNDIKKIKHATTGVSDEWKKVFKGKVEEEYRLIFGNAEEALGYFNEEEKSYTQKKYFNVSNRIKKWNELYEQIKFPIQLVAIETKAQCNRRCSYCPVSKCSPRKGELSIENIESIFKQLAELKYQGQIRLHYYNEPLLDSRLLSIVRLLREYLPENFFRLTTNGDFIDLQTIYDLVKDGVSQIKISVHDSKIHDKMKNILSSVTNDSIINKIMITVYYHHFKAINRGGFIRQNDINPKKATVIGGANPDGCDRLEFNIDYKGNVFPCCHSFDGSYLLGNINQNSLIEIYEANKHNFKDHFYGNYFYSVCRKCALNEERF